MGKRLQFRRLIGLAAVLTLAFAALGYRLADLQVIRHQELTEKARQNTQRIYLREARRGDILDVRGNLLATSIPVERVCVDPTLINGYQAQVAHALAPLLNQREAELYRRLQLQFRKNAKAETVTNQYVVLQRKVSLQTWAKIRDAMRHLTLVARGTKLSKKERIALENLKEDGVFAEDDQERVYPNGKLAAHILGFTTTEELTVEGKPFSEMKGLDGIELVFNKQLEGVPGWVVTEADRHDREIVSLRDEDVEPENGLNVVLSIDSVIQSIVESELAAAMQEHKPISVCGIVVRPRTGEILAMATLPNYDPNNPGAYTLSQRRDRPVTDVDEPGSTFKIVTVSGALNEGLVHLTDRFYCEHGHWSYGGRTLGDHEPFDILSVEQIIGKSSNIGAGKIGLLLGPNRLYNYICKYGFGSRTGIPLPGEVWGIVHPIRKWSKVTIVQLPMGQGISVTRLQMVMAMCAIANKGVLMRPMLVERLEKNHHVYAQYCPQENHRVISEATAAKMVTALKTVVSPQGTAPNAALDHYTVAGKTGTAWKAENGHYVRKYFTSFIGFFPADDPQVCISVTLDEPERKFGFYGGAVAGPVFKRIAERVANYLNIAPDKDITAPAGGPLAPPDVPAALRTASAGNP
jgi:cell division protein FtsI (penicillin-binding protein 3)